MPEEQTEKPLTWKVANLSITLHYTNIDKAEYIGDVGIEYEGESKEFRFWKQPQGRVYSEKEQNGWPFKAKDYRLDKEIHPYDFERFFAKSIKDSIDTRNKDPKLLSFWEELHLDNALDYISWKVFWRNF